MWPLLLCCCYIRQLYFIVLDLFNQILQPSKSPSEWLLVHPSQNDVLCVYYEQYSMYTDWGRLNSAVKVWPGLLQRSWSYWITVPAVKAAYRSGEFRLLPPWLLFSFPWISSFSQTAFEQQRCPKTTHIRLRKSDAWRIISLAYVLGLAYWLYRNQGDALKWSIPLCTVLVKRGLAENSWVFHQFWFPCTTCCKSRSSRWSVLPLVHTFTQDAAQNVKTYFPYIGNKLWHKITRPN